MLSAGSPVDRTSNLLFPVFKVVRCCWPKLALLGPAGVQVLISHIGVANAVSNSLRWT